jgi:hypothetical protein
MNDMSSVIYIYNLPRSCPPKLRIKFLDLKNIFLAYFDPKTLNKHHWCLNKPLFQFKTSLNWSKNSQTKRDSLSTDLRFSCKLKVKTSSWKFFYWMKLDTKIDRFYKWNMTNWQLSFFFSIIWRVSLFSLKPRYWKINKINFQTKTKILKTIGKVSGLKISSYTNLIIATRFIFILYFGSLLLNFVFIKQIDHLIDYKRLPIRKKRS